MATYNFTTTDTDFTIVLDDVDQGTWDKDTGADITSENISMSSNGDAITINLLNPYFSTVITSDDVVTIDEEEQEGTLDELEEALLGVFTTSGGSGGPVEVTVLKTRVVLTNEQILDLNNTYVEVVPAPGEGKVLMFVGALLTWDLTDGYSNSGGNARVFISYGDYSFEASGLGLPQAGAGIATTMLLPVAYVDTDAGWPNYVKSPAAFSDNLPLKICFYSSNGNMTGGGSSNRLIVQTLYSIVDL